MHLSLFGSKRLFRTCVGVFSALLLVLGLTGPAQGAASVTTPTSVTISAATGKACPTAVSNRPTLRVGDTGACVKVMQQLLLDKGYVIGTAKPDGIYGPKTKKAVLAFQKDAKLVQDAVVGPITWGSLTSKSTAKPRGNPKTSGAPAILTFDDCPVSKKSANETFETAHDLKIHLRLYVTGDCLKKGKFDVTYAKKMGHEVCSHSNTHAYLPGLSLAGIRKEMAVPLKTNCARPPYGAVNANVKKVFKEKGLRLDLWTIDTNDWRGKSQSQVVSYVTTHSQRGSVVLMHMQHKAFNPSALKAMKSGLNKRGIAVK